MASRASHATLLSNPPTRISRLPWSRLARSGVHPATHHPQRIQGQNSFKVLRSQPSRHCVSDVPGLLAWQPKADIAGEVLPALPGPLVTLRLGRHAGQTHRWHIGHHFSHLPHTHTHTQKPPSHQPGFNANL